MAINQRQAAIISWGAGFLALLLLVVSPPSVPSDSWGLWLTIVALTAFVVNFGLTFSQGEINGAHVVGIMAYLMLATPGDSGNALWAVAIGAFLGVLLRETTRHYWRDWGMLLRNVWSPAIRTVGQLVLGLAIGGWIYQQLDGNLPLDHFETNDVLPVLGFMTTCLAVYLTLLLIYVRGRQGPMFGEVVRLNWQSLVGVLLVPVPFGILGSVVYTAISSLTFGLVSIGIGVIIVGIYGLSRTQHLYEQQVRDLSTLATISNAMRTNLNMASLLEVLYLQVASLLEVSNFAVALYDPIQERIAIPIHIRAGRRINLPSVVYEIQHPSEKVASHISKYIIDHAVKIGIVPDNLSSYAWMGAPIQTSDQTIGAIVVAADDDTHQFTPQDQQLLSTIAAQSGMALDSAQLYEKARNRVTQLRTLTRISAELSSTLNYQRVLDHIVSFARQAVGAEAAAIYAWRDDTRQVLDLLRHEGLSEAFLDDPPLPLITRRGNLEAHQQPVVIFDVHRDAHSEQLNEIMDREGKRAWVEVMLQNAEEALGVLVVYYDTPHRQSDEDIEVLQTYANQAALAIVNARLYSHIDTALSRRVGQLSLLEALGHELFSSRISLSEIGQQVLRRAAEGTGAQAGLLALKDDKDKDFILAATLGTDSTDEIVEITRHVLKTADATIIRDVQTNARFVPLNEATRAMLSVPILDDVSVIGALTLESDTPNCFGDEDMIFVMQVGAQIRIAMENARLIQRIEANRDRLQTILDSMKEGIVLVDTDGVVRLANPRVGQLLNIDPASLIGYPAENFLYLAQEFGIEAHTLHQWCMGLRSGKWEPDGSRHLYSRIQGGQQRFLDRADVAVKDQQGAVIGWLMVFVDVTEEQELKQAREDLYSMIIHDLRSPLTAVNAGLKLIDNLAASSEISTRDIMHQTTANAGRAVRKLLNLVNSLLDIAKMENGTITLELEPASLNNIVTTILEELGPLAQEMEVKLLQEIPKNLPQLDVDAEKVERILLNLVDNAIKFTPSKGKVTIRASLLDPVGSIPSLIVQVIDTGPGIPDEYKSSLFDRYAQVEGRRGRRQGTGLGLTFCRLAVEAHGGIIWIEDNPHGGSIFCFTLPLVDLVA